MSTAPSPAPSPNNKMMFALAGIIGSIVVLCSGLMVMALVSGYALERGRASATNRSPATRPFVRETGDAKPNTGEGTDDNPGAYEIASRFLTALKLGRYEDAYRLTSESLQGEEEQPDFRTRMQKMTAFRNHTSSSLERPTGRVVGGGKVPIRGYVTGPNGQARFTMEVVQEENGDWRVSGFGKD